jgi:hypothetical protein
MDRGRCGLDLESNKFLREQKVPPHFSPSVMYCVLLCDVL